MNNTVDRLSEFCLFWAINVRFAKKMADSSQLIILLILLLGIFRQGIEERNQIYVLSAVKVLVKKPI